MVDKSYAQEAVEARTGRELVAHLQELYIERRWTDQEIAGLLGVSRSTVRTWRSEFGIDRSARRAVA